MNLKDDIRPVSYVKLHTADVLKQVNSTRRPVYVTQNGEAMGVIMDTYSYEKMQATLGLLKLIAQSEKEIEEGKVVEQSDVFSEIEKKYFSNE